MPLVPAPCDAAPVAPTRERVTLSLFTTAAALCLATVVLTAVTPGEGADIGAGFLVLAAMVTGLAATIRVVQQQADQMQDRGPGLGRRTLTWIAIGSALAAALAAAVGQWPLAVAAIVPALACVFYASLDRTA
jgi:hypothetical protein